MQYINISAYKFISLDQLATRQGRLKKKCEELNLKGTILLSAEGININLAGLPADIEAVEQYLISLTELADLRFKHSPSESLPFSRLKVRIREEIITFKQTDIKPETHTVRHLPPVAFKQMLDANQDNVLVLDTRNKYEIQFGKFKDAVELDIDNFTEFTDAVATQLAEHKNKTVVMYCTGGVRCEKAGPAMEALGFNDIYQLEDGILGYFEACGDAHYQGDCFVFDDRIAVNPSLQQSAAQTAKE